MRSKIMDTEYKSTEKQRERWNFYMRERRKKIKLGLIKPIPFSQKNKTKDKHYHRDYQRRARLKAITHYGGKCICCGETEIKFLSIDHIDGGGGKHRKIIGTNSSMWVIRNNFPSGFQILCHNCNMAKGIYGECPHNLQTTN